MFYFHYWLSSEPIKAIIDFDPQDKAKILFEEVYEEISYHIGEEPNPGSLLFVEMFGLRPFNPAAWEMSLEQFVSYYGNEFVVFDLEQPIVGDIEHFRPKQIEGGQRNKFMNISVNNKEEWDKRSKFETRLVSALIRYFQFYKKTKWLLVLPLDGIKYNHRVWKVSTDIPETNYTAEWRIILADGYPEKQPKLFIRKKDVYVVADDSFDYSLLWKDKDGTIFYHITQVDEDSTRWEENSFLVDFLLTGLWNFLVRSLHQTFNRIYFYKVNISQPSTIMDVPERTHPIIRRVEHRPLDEDQDFEEEPDWKVQITEVMEDIVLDQQTMESKIHQNGFGVLESSPESRKVTSKEIKHKELDGTVIGKDSKTVSESKYQDWILKKSDEALIKQYAQFFTWLLQRVPERALKELNQLKEFDSEHEIFNLINWRLVQDDISEQDLFPFAPYIINYYLEKADNEIYDTDRKFLRETVLKNWKDIENVPKLRELLKKTVKLIRPVEYESIA
jgi:hypothetical protein